MGFGKGSISYKLANNIFRPLSDTAGISEDLLFHQEVV
jgi:hypothetical protein